MIAAEFCQFMEVDVFEGGNGDLVLCQEWPSLDRGERYVRILLPMDQATRLAETILAVARKSRLS